MSLKEQWQTIKKNWLLVLVVVIVFLIFFFSGNGLTSYGKFVAPEMMDLAVSSRGGVYYDESGFAPQAEERIITKTTYLSSEIQRGTFFAVSQQLKDIIAASDSILLNENVNKYDQGRKEIYSGYYQIKVISTEYGSFIAQLKELGEVDSFTETATDITGSYIKLQDELDLEKERLTRYEAIYQKATSLSDQIELNDHIFNQERTIKHLEDALENKDLQVSYITVSFSMREKESAYANIIFIKFSELISRLVNGLNSLLGWAFYLLPWAALALIIWLVYRFTKKRR